MAVLGLVIEHPNETASHIAQRLEERFPQCRFSPSTAHNALPQMARGSKIRVRCTAQAGASERHLDRYEPTEVGMQEFDEWMFAQPSGVPALREAMYGRIELCKLQDLPRLIRLAREEEGIATALYSEASLKLVEYDGSKQGRRVEDFERAVRQVLLYVAPMHWSARAACNAEIADRLEEIAREAGLDLGVCGG